MFSIQVDLVVKDRTGVESVHMRKGIHFVTDGWPLEGIEASVKIPREDSKLTAEAGTMD